MSNEMVKSGDRHVSPFERIKRVNEAGSEYWSSRDFAAVLGYADYRNFEAVVDKAKLSCFNSGHRVEDHFVDVTEMTCKTPHACARISLGVFLPRSVRSKSRS